VPETIPVASFAFGAVLILVTLLGGRGFKIFGTEVLPGRIGIVPRMVGGVLVPTAPDELPQQVSRRISGGLSSRFPVLSYKFLVPSWAFDRYPMAAPQGSY
jgi:hypothetical protein